MLCIQDPDLNGSKLLHEALLEACSNALYGAGAYAFATAGGIEMFFKDNVFAEFIASGKYHLIIGMDAITNTRSIDTLITIERHYRKHLCVNAFIDNALGSIFHPKFSWFRTTNGGVIIVGSGNLTQKGLRRNREAFVYNEVTAAEIALIERQWEMWVNRTSNKLKPLTDRSVFERAEQNSLVVMPRKHIVKKAEFIVPIDETDEQDAWEYDGNSSVLIAEIPNGGNRWSQANFDTRTFREFFGAQPGSNGSYRIISRNVLWDGSLGTVRIRPAVSVASQNYRFELENSEGLPYPRDGRPISVFAKIAERTFLYMIVFPGQEQYDSLQKVVSEHRFAHNRCVRFVTTAKVLDDITPDLPLLYYKK